MKSACRVFLILIIIFSGIGIFLGVCIANGAFIESLYYMVSNVRALGFSISCFSVFPIIIAFFALTKLETAKKKDSIITIAIFTLLFCSLIAGILMLCLSDKDFQYNESLDE